jgi:hypothetical protein
MCVDRGEARHGFEWDGGRPECAVLPLQFSQQLAYFALAWHSIGETMTTKFDPSKSAFDVPSSRVRRETVRAEPPVPATYIKLVIVREDDDDQAAPTYVTPIIVRDE